MQKKTFKMDCFTSESVIRGYHIHKEVWEASLGETMVCAIESGNAFDPFAVSVVRDREIISYIPRKSRPQFLRPFCF